MLRSVPVRRRGALLHGSDDPQHPVVIVGEDFLELGQILTEVVQDLFAARGAGGFHMLADQLLQGGNIVLMLHGFEADRLFVHPLVEVPVLIQHIGDAAGHAGCKVLAGLAQHDDGAAGHVLAAMVADALHNGRCAGVADAEALTGHAGDEGLAAGGTIQATLPVMMFSSGL